MNKELKISGFSIWLEIVFDRFSYRPWALATPMDNMTIFSWFNMCDRLCDEHMCMLCAELRTANDGNEAWLMTKAGQIV